MNKPDAPTSGFSGGFCDIGGVEAGFAAVNAGNYPYARMLHLYTGKGKETPATLDFIQFILSPNGQKVLTKAGYVPLP